MKPPLKDFKNATYPHGQVTQWFGENFSLYKRFGMKGHNGIDYVQPHGSPMYAIENATVVSVDDNPDGFGKHVRILSERRNSDGYHREWTYGHCDKIYVKVNDVVRAGQHIADMGNTGFVVSGATPYLRFNPYAGTHLHLGLRQVRKIRTGWSYPGSKVKIDIIDYNNGYRGGIDPRPIMDMLSEATEDPRKPLIAELRKLLIMKIQRLQAQINAMQTGGDNSGK